MNIRDEILKHRLECSDEASSTTLTTIRELLIQAKGRFIDKDAIIIADQWELLSAGTPGRVIGFAWNKNQPIFDNVHSALLTDGIDMSHDMDGNLIFTLVKTEAVKPIGARTVQVRLSALSYVYTSVTLTVKDDETWESYHARAIALGDSGDYEWTYNGVKDGTIQVDGETTI